MILLAYILSAIAFALILLILVILARTFAFKPARASADAKSLDPGEPAREVLDRLSAAITFPTIAAQNYAETDFAPFDAYIEWLAQAFPLFHRTCTLERVNGYALLYRWAGSEPALKPLLLMAHYDVVPVEAGTEGDWTHPPFGGVLADGILWGRGTLDIKSQMIAHIEAAEALMKDGFTPKRDIYFSYGNDEEIGGGNGASSVVELLEARGIELEGVLDEGGLVATGAVKAVDTPLALIGIAEKGHTNLKITVSGAGGHSSMPPRRTALGELSRLVSALERRPRPQKLVPAVEALFRAVSGEMGFTVRMAMANLWLFRPLLLSVLSQSSSTDALIHTTIVPTMSHASEAPNVLPQKAEAVVNVRLLPGDTIAGIESHVREEARRLSIAATVEVFHLANEPTPVSPIESVDKSGAPTFYGRLESLIGRFYPQALIAPYLVTGGTDSRKFYPICQAVYRFTPILLTDGEHQLMHNTDERISVENYARMILFFRQLIEES